MPSVSANSLIQVGTADQLANRIGNTLRTIAGVGTAQTGAATITPNSNCVLGTTAGGATAFVTSTKWQVGDSFLFFNTSATAALVYPQSGGAFNGGSTNASISVAQNTGVELLKTSSTAWRAIASSASITGSFTTITASSTIAGASSILSSSPTGGVGYATGAGGAVTQITSRTTGVTLNTDTGAITLVSAAGSATPASFTVTNSAVAATDVVIVNQKSGTDLYEIFVTAVGAGSFRITSFTTGGTTTETPVFNFAVIKGVAA